MRISKFKSSRVREAETQDLPPGNCFQLAKDSRPEPESVVVGEWRLGREFGGENRNSLEAADRDKAALAAARVLGGLQGVEEMEIADIGEAEEVARL